jgi:hypothetical protein
MALLQQAASVTPDPVPLHRQAATAYEALPLTLLQQHAAA